MTPILKKLTRARAVQKGFTLIELLVVIAIIGMLSSVVLASLNEARGKARDASRKATMRSLQTALELYYSSYGAYPSTGGSFYSSEPGDSQWVPNGPGNNGIWIPGLAPLHIAALPRDPRGGVTSDIGCRNGGWKAAYLYSSIDGKNYTLLSHCGPEKTVLSTDTFYDSIRPGYAFKICSAPSTTSCQ